MNAQNSSPGVNNAGGNPGPESPDDEKIARIAHEVAERSMRAAMAAHGPPKESRASFGSWLSDQGLIRTVLGIIALALTAMFCVTLVTAVYRDANFELFEPYARLILGSLATIVAYLVGNFAGERSSKNRKS